MPTTPTVAFPLARLAVSLSSRPSAGASFGRSVAIAPCRAANFIHQLHAPTPTPRAKVRGEATSLAGPACNVPTPPGGDQSKNSTGSGRDQGEPSARFAISLSRSGTDQVLAQAVAAPASPADLPRRDAHNQGMGRYVARHDAAGPNHGVFPDPMAANDGGIGPDGSAALHQRGPEFILPAHMSAGVQYIGKHHTGSAKHVILERNAVEDRDIVLNLAAAADRDIRSDHHVLSDHAPFPDPAAGENVGEMPDLGAATDLHPRIDDRCRMGEIAFRHAGSFRLRRCAESGALRFDRHEAELLRNGSSGVAERSIQLFLVQPDSVDQDGAADICVDELRPAEARLGQVRAGEICVRQIGPAQIRASQVRADEDRTCQIGAGKVRIDELAVAEIATYQPEASEVGSEERRGAKVDAAQVEPLAASLPPRADRARSQNRQRQDYVVETSSLAC